MEASKTGALSSLELTVRSARVRVRAADVVEPRVTVGTAEIGADGRIAARGSSAIELECPIGTDVTIGTTSGSVECSGALGRLSISTHSGSVRVERGTQVSIRTWSGAVAVDHADESCLVVTHSGEVQIGSAPHVDVTCSSGSATIAAGRDATVHSGSGAVHVCCCAPGEVDVHTMSGSVVVSIMGDWSPACELASRSGRIDNLLAEPPHPTGAVAVATASGRITVQAE